LKEPRYMTEDQFHIEMEDISTYPLQRSADYSFWEEITFEDLQTSILATLTDEKLKTFLGVVRNGSAFKLGEYFYRINTDWHGTTYIHLPAVVI